MGLFCAAIIKYSVSLIKFPFLNYVQFFSCDISLVHLLKYPYSWFSSGCFLLLLLLLSPYFCCLFLCCQYYFWSLYSVFCALLSVVFETLYRCIDAIINAGMSSSSFLTHIVCLRHLCDVRPYVLSWVFLYSGPFVKVLQSITLRVIPNFLRRWQTRYLSLSYDFCSVVFFRVLFSFSWGIFKIFFCFYPHLFDGVHF